MSDRIELAMSIDLDIIDEMSQVVPLLDNMDECDRDKILWSMRSAYAKGREDGAVQIRDLYQGDQRAVRRARH